MPRMGFLAAIFASMWSVTSLNLGWVGCGILALTNMSLREGGFLYETMKFAFSKSMVALDCSDS